MSGRGRSKESTLLLRLDGQGTLYQQTYRALRAAIRQLSPGARLPPTRFVASELGLSRNTVLAAYGQLTTEGFVAARAGAGTHVAAAAPPAGAAPRALEPPRRTDRRPRRVSPGLSAFARRIVHQDPSPILQRPGLRWDFRYGLPTVGDFPHLLWLRLLARRARVASVPSLGYGEPQGYQPLREALADYLRRGRGVASDPGQVIVVNGSQQALDLAARVLLDPGDGVVLEEPHYEGARQAFAAAGARLIPVPVDADGLDVAAVPRRARRVRLLYVTPSHQFPTGAVMPLERRRRLLAWARAAGAHVLEDDYDSEYRYDVRPLEAVQGLDPERRVIYVSTLSKVLFPSLRLGYLVLPPPLVTSFVTAKHVTDRHTTTLLQATLADFIREGHFARHLRRSRARNARRRLALLGAIADHLRDQVEVAGAAAGVHVLLWLPGRRPEDLPALVSRAERAGVGIYPITPYYLRPPDRAGLLLGYASMSEAEIREGIARLAEVVRRGR
jgi:GntR family transcriptional regulator/MocR family aminotransferase